MIDAHAITAYEAAPRQARTSLVGRVFLAVILCVVLEGAVRKWLASSLTVPLVLLRDSLALFVIVVSLRRGTLNFRSAGPQVLAMWTGLVLLWGTLQTVVNGTPPTLLVIGLRFWLLYLWFGYAVAASMTERDYMAAKRLVLYLMVAHVPLVIVQHFLPPGAFLNRQLDGDEESVFIVAAGIVRTTGTFSFTAAYAIFIATATPLVLGLFDGTVGRSAVERCRILLLAGLAAATLVSGSRAALVFFAAAAVVYMLLAILTKRRSNFRATAVMLVFALVTGAAFSYLFDRAIDASRERFESASEAEDVTQRVLAIFVGEPYVYKNFTYLGHGIGMGSNFAGVAAGQHTFLLAETEAGRTVLEGGLLGLAWAGMKVLVILIGLRAAFRRLRREGRITPMLLWVTTAYAGLTWPIVGQLTVNALAYVLLALAVGSLRFERRAR
jgi:hypothetical protein